MTTQEHNPAGNSANLTANNCLVDKNERQNKTMYSLHLITWQRSRFAYKCSSGRPWYEYMEPWALNRINESFPCCSFKPHNKFVLRCVCAIQSASLPRASSSALVQYVYRGEKDSLLCRKYGLFDLYASREGCAHMPHIQLHAATLVFNQWNCCFPLSFVGFEGKLIDLWTIRGSLLSSLGLFGLTTALGCLGVKTVAVTDHSRHAGD